MANALDLLYCEKCGTYYQPQHDNMGKLISHCVVGYRLTEHLGKHVDIKV